MVMVPVLSNARALSLARFSIKTVPLIITPVLEMAPIPPKNDKGTDKTRAQGQDTTRNTSARVPQSAQEAPSINKGTRASSAAQKTTIGVYHTAKRRIKASGRDLFAAASSIRFSNRVIDEFL